MNIRNFHNLKKFYENIGFYHPEKQNKLVKIMKFPGRKSYARGETKEMIINLLTIQPLTRRELSKKLNKSVFTIDTNLNKLRKEQKIKSFKYKDQIKSKVI